METNEKSDQLFFTVSIYKWIHVLKSDICKDIIIESLNFLVNNGKVKVYAFVIMPNHIHLIWQIQANFKLKDVQRDFLKYTGQQIKYWLKNNHPQFLEHFKVDLKDRKYQFWQNRALSVVLYNQQVFEQKLDYIHNLLSLDDRTFMPQGNKEAIDKELKDLQPVVQGMLKTEWNRVKRVEPF